ncbi:MAG: hemolysin family protein [Candidatus Acidiferrales bacterium]
MAILLHILSVMCLCVGLAVFSYVDRIYLELGRAATGRLHDRLNVFESDVEPRIDLDRRRAARGFRILAQLWLVLVVVETARGVLLFVPEAWSALVQLVVYLLLEVVVCAHFIPELLLARTTGRWLARFAPLLRGFLWVVWPLRAGLDGAISLARLSDEESPESRSSEQGIGALVEAAESQGMIERDEAQMIEQVVEFSEKRMPEVMTPRPDVVVIPASSTLEQLRRLMVETKFSRVPVYGETLDDVIGIAYSRDLLQVPEQDAQRRLVRELARPALFVPETKRGSELLKEMQRKNQQMAIVVDEHGLLAGVVTAEDLIEEIVGEIGEEDRLLAPDVVRESDGSLVLRGSVSLEKAEELFGVEFGAAADEGATTIGGLINHVLGHVPKPGERAESGGVSFEVLEANQRKVLRLRARRAAVVPVRQASAR